MVEKAGGRRSVPDRLVREAVRTLEAWEKGRWLQELLHAPGPVRDEVPRAALANGLLTLFRHRAVIDWVLGQVAERRVRPRLLPALRWCTCQLLYMDGVPPPVAVDACVRYLRRRHSVREAGFANAALRRIAARPRDDWLAKAAGTGPDHVRLDLSPELHEAWRDRWSPAGLRAVARLLQEHAPLIVRERPGETLPPDAGLRREPAPSWAPEAKLFHCVDAPRFFRAVADQPGSFYVQDPSTLLAPSVLAARPGETVADLCSAPGGKSLLLAERLEGRGRLLCTDRSLRRLRVAAENLTGLPVCLLAAGDAASPPARSGTFDAVLVDAPCSNTGVIRRRPDVRWRFARRGVADLAAIQSRILLAAAELVKPGGRLVYSTCSTEPEENGSRAREFLLQRPEFRLALERQLFPCRRWDGAYVARLERPA